ncbi:MAG: DUF2344 domain-containing protein [Phycisphaerales bacterium]|nr:MAG: DUF2344 domain-containing protein [Phycisphaerales bacterium]
MDNTETGESGKADVRHRWAFAYSIDGDLRFISHRDTLRMFRRALARADLPVRFSEGFNPHPRIMIPLPRPVGVASDAETIVVEFERRIDPDEALSRLEKHTPSGVSLRSVRRLAPNERCIPQSARYRLAVDRQEQNGVDDKVRGLLEHDVVNIERKTPKSGSVRSIDIRKYIDDMRVVGGAVEFTLRFTQDGTARPAEVASILGYDRESINHRIRRMEVQWY